MLQFFCLFLVIANVNGCVLSSSSSSASYSSSSASFTSSSSSSSSSGSSSSEEFQSAMMSLRCLNHLLNSFEKPSTGMGSAHCSEAAKSGGLSLVTATLIFARSFNNFSQQISKLQEGATNVGLPAAKAFSEQIPTLVGGLDGVTDSVDLLGRRVGHGFADGANSLGAGLAWIGNGMSDLGEGLEHGAENVGAKSAKKISDSLDLSVTRLNNIATRAGSAVTQASGDARYASENLRETAIIGIIGVAVITIVGIALYKWWPSKDEKLKDAQRKKIEAELASEKKRAESWEQYVKCRIGSDDCKNQGAAYFAAGGSAEQFEKFEKTRRLYFSSSN